MTDRTHYSVAFYNVGPIGENGRGPGVLETELKALAGTGAKVIGACETIGWGDLPDLRNYDKIRSRKKDGRANVAAWIHQSLDFRPQDVRWHDLETQWQRTEHPGMHAARSFLEVVIDGGQWFFGHQPPRGIKDIHGNWATDEAQQEGVNLLARRMQPENRDGWAARTQASKKKALNRLRLVLWDPNRDPHAPVVEPGPNQLAHRIGGWAAGTPIEGGVIRGGQFTKPRKQAVVTGVHLGSDHHGAFLATVVKT